MKYARNLPGFCKNLSSSVRLKGEYLGRSEAGVRLPCEASFKRRSNSLMGSVCKLAKNAITTKNEQRVHILGVDIVWVSVQLHWGRSEADWTGTVFKTWNENITLNFVGIIFWLGCAGRVFNFEYFGNNVTRCFNWHRGVQSQGNDEIRTWSDFIGKRRNYSINKRRYCENWFKEWDVFNSWGRK